MNTYEIRVLVEYNYTVEADSAEEAEEMGYEYEDYRWNAVVDTIEVQEVNNEL